MSSIKSLLAEYRAGLDTREPSGFIKTEIPGVRFFWAEEHVARAPMLYDASIIVIGQGHKVGHINGRSFRYDADHYLIASMPSPADCESYASKDKPLMGIVIDVDLTVLNGLVEQLAVQGSGVQNGKDDLCHSIEPAGLDENMKDAVIRLLKCLLSPMEIRVLGRGILREILFRAMLSDHGASLLALTKDHSHTSRISRSLTYLHSNYMKSMSIDELADRSNMSASTFHRCFKAITGQSPWQYLKKVRMEKARQLILNNHSPAGVAARAVGYESNSQFSREFKKHFGVTPTQLKGGSIAQVELNN